MTAEIIIAILSALVGGFITFIFTIASDKRKEKREDKLESKKLQREAFENRPEMQIIDFKDYISRPGYGVKQKCDIDIFVARISGTTIDGDKKHPIVNAHYCEDNLKTDEWRCVIYFLKNAGKTSISTLDVICHFQQTTCIFPSSEVRQYMEGNLLNYSYCYDKKIREGDTITLKFCYHKERIVPGLISAVMSIGMIDDNGRYWTQTLFAPQDKIYDSRSISVKEYNEEIRTDIAVECFKKPWLW